VWDERLTIGGDSQWRRQRGRMVCGGMVSIGEKADEMAVVGNKMVVGAEVGGVNSRVVLVGIGGVGSTVGGGGAMQVVHNFCRSICRDDFSITPTW
jgi:hypothetical protein